MSFIAERQIARIQWDHLRTMLGIGDPGVGVSLGRLLDAKNSSEAEDAYWHLENIIVVQGSVYEAAEAAVSVLVAALCETRPKFVRIAVLDLILQIVTGRPDVSEIQHGNALLVERCKARAREGLWTLTAEYVHGERDAAEDVLAAVDPAHLETFRDLS